MLVLKFLHGQFFSTPYGPFPLQLLIQKVKELVPSTEEMVSFTSLLEGGHRRVEGRGEERGEGEMEDEEGMREDGEWE